MEYYQLIQHRNKLSYSLMKEQDFVKARFEKIKQLKRRDDKMIDGCLALYVFAAEAELKDELIKFLEQLDPEKVKERLINLYKITINENMRNIKGFLIEATTITDT